jgi:transcriptional regulator with GAF, ATPase, and Fis domain
MSALRVPLAPTPATADEISGETWRQLLIGQSPPMRRIGELIGLLGPRRATVLITGETGTGKELVARALHLAGPRRRSPWVAVNCSALPENLLESELFGHVRGAFTGAVQTRIGRFEQANGGTLFLDEIGDLPILLQAKLLRALQEREFQRLGSSETVRVDVRVVAATNCELLDRIRRGQFREDLYYRLNVAPVSAPPLRERAGDVRLLAEHFVRKVCSAEDLDLKSISLEAIERLEDYGWPGNVRQLENAVETAVALSGSRCLLEPKDFPIPTDFQAPTPVLDDRFSYEETVARFEHDLLEQALRKTGGNKKAAAELLGLKRTTLSAKVRSLGGIDSGTNHRFSWTVNSGAA